MIRPGGRGIAGETIYAGPPDGRPLPVVPLLALTAALPGCGGEDPVAATGGGIAIALDEYRVIPQLITARPGELRITLRNRGRLPHNLELRRNGREVFRISTLLPGEQDSGTVTLRRGGYRLACSIGNHEELGQYGSLTVK